jgi:hypothetical protein
VVVALSSSQSDLFPEAARLTDARGEFASTPRWLATAALRLVPTALRPREVLDLGAGLGGLAEASVAYYGSSIELITAVEREPDRCADMQGRHGDWSVVQADVEQWAPRQGRRDLGGQDRHAGLWRDHPPGAVGISPRRPRGPGWDDARTIVAAVWTPGILRASGTHLEWMEVEP